MNGSCDNTDIGSDDGMKKVACSSRSQLCATLCLSASEHQELCSAFELFDTEKNGIVSISDVRSILEELATIPVSTDFAHRDGVHEHASSSAFENLVSALKKMPDDKQLSLDDFVRLMTAPKAADAVIDEIAQVFDLFDHDGKGCICMKDLQLVANDLGENMTENELNEMIQTVSTSDKVTYEQFRNIIEKRLFAA